MGNWGNVKGGVVAVRFPDEVLERIEEKAAAEDLSAGLWIKKAVLEFLEHLTTCENTCSA
jgi:predicted HicB family RNase H-like nuclease